MLWLYVNNIEKLNVAYYAELYFKYENADDFIEAVRRKVIKITDDVREEIISEKWITKCENILSYMESKNIRVTFYRSENFPVRLKEIDFPPPILYYIGDISLCDKNTVAVVGSRRASSYGRKCTANFCEEFAKNGVCVVSGMADGIDAYAHWGILENNGDTVAFLAGGVDYIYPPSNRGLYEKLCSDGLVLSEFPLKLRPQKPYFPYRNRLISGLSHCVVVIESGYPSGTMSTVDYALDQGREVYAVPGSVNSELSAGTNFLIRNGCNCAIDPYDVLAEFDIFQIDASKSPIPYDESLDEIQIEILKRLSIEDLTFEQLEDELNIDSDQLNMSLTALEILGFVQKEAGRAYTLINKKAE